MRQARQTGLGMIGLKGVVLRLNSALLAVAREPRCAAVLFLLMSCLVPSTSWSGTLGELTAERKAILKEQFAVLLDKRKGPFDRNVCVCQDGRKEVVRGRDGAFTTGCGDKIVFCGAFRAPWAQVLAEQGVYVGNIFTNDLHEWESSPDHHNLVRGYVLEKFFIDTHPDHRLAVARTMRGVAGAEYEAPALRTFVERYLGLDSFDDSRHFLLAYELQRRFFVDNDTGRIDKVRNMATQIEQQDSDFKPLRDAVHNQISAVLIPRLTDYKDRRAKGAVREQIAKLIAEIEKLTALDEEALRPRLAKIEEAGLRAQLEALMPAGDPPPLEVVESLAQIMAQARESVAANSISPADARRLVDVNVIAAAVIQSQGNAFLEAEQAGTVAEHFRFLFALAEATYGVGLLTERERKAARGYLALGSGEAEVTRDDFTRRLERAGRLVAWAQAGAQSAFGEVWEAWILLMPEVAQISDDILRGSPLLLFAQAVTRLEDHAAGPDPVRHEVMGEAFTRGLRGLNPGLARGLLRVNPEGDDYSRDQVVALAQTPPELQPVAGIATQGEGNMLSHVQLLARSLGIPNVVTDSEPFARIAARDGQEVFYLVTPGGRVYLKEAAQMTAADQAIYAEFHRNTNPGSDGSLGAAGTKLDIDSESLDLDTILPLALSELSIADSGIRAGPKAAYLGELKRLFPDKVSRGVVIPFGAYYAHYRDAKVAVPSELSGSGVAEAGEALPSFVERTYETFFGEMIPGGADEAALRAWIEPRLAVIRQSITERPLSQELRDAIRQSLDEKGLLKAEDKTQTVGCFVRSDTNVEDLDNFSGAGLNLTLFNLGSLKDIYDGIRQVWASPFTYRSFSWRQPLIDEPLWVLPSIVILESIASEKSGVLVTADILNGEEGKMVVATSEGVGGAVDGTPAETLLWSPGEVELVMPYKSAWRLMLKPEGGSEVVPSTGAQQVLSEDELGRLVAAAKEIDSRLEPAKDEAGRPRPWDIEFGFAKGRLWLFQVRPFVGNEELANMPALAALDPPTAPKRESIGLADVVQ